MAVDVDAIRSRFIQENLRRALQEPDTARAARALRAFHNYFQWFEHRLSDLEKLAITAQLARLQDAYSGDGAYDRSSDPYEASAR